MRGGHGKCVDLLQLISQGASARRKLLGSIAHADAVEKIKKNAMNGCDDAMNRPIFSTKKTQRNISFVLNTKNEKTDRKGELKWHKSCSSEKKADDDEIQQKSRRAK